MGTIKSNKLQSLMTDRNISYKGCALIPANTFYLMIVSVGRQTDPLTIVYEIFTYLSAVYMEGFFIIY